MPYYGDEMDPRWNDPDTDPVDDEANPSENQKNWAQGRLDGEADARAAWSCGKWWRRSTRELPADHSTRQDYLAAYAQGFARYNMSIHNRYAEGGEQT